MDALVILQEKFFLLATNLEFSVSQENKTKESYDVCFNAKQTPYSFLQSERKLPTILNSYILIYGVFTYAFFLWRKLFSNYCRRK